MYAHFADEAYQKLITLITLTHLEENKRELYDTRILSCVRVLSTDQNTSGVLSFSSRKREN